METYAQTNNSGSFFSVSLALYWMYLGVIVKEGVNKPYHPILSPLL
jgi:hypothetical protein